MKMVMVRMKMEMASQMKMTVQMTKVKSERYNKVLLYHPSPPHYAPAGVMYS